MTDDPNPTAVSAQGSYEHWLQQNREHIKALEAEIERLRVLLMKVVCEREDLYGKHQKACLKIEWLRTALSWLEDHEPQLVDQARELFLSGID